MSAELHAHVAAHLRIDDIVYTVSRKNTRLLVDALMTCEEHGGTHHFAVIGDGTQIGMTSTARQCLESQGWLT